MITSRVALSLLLLVAVALTAAGCLVSINGGKDNIIYIPLNPTTSPTPTVQRTLSVYDQPSGYWIEIDPIGDKQAGDLFPIHSRTNLSVGEEVLVQVYSATFSHALKSSTKKFSGAAGTVKVIPGRNGTNTISFMVNSTASNLVPDKYIVYEFALNQNATGNMLFNVTPGKIP